MARKCRDYIPGALYHVMLRGNNGQPIFVDDVDRERFGWLVNDGVRRYRHRIHAYCWMNNHIHLAVQCGEASLSQVMQNLAFRYAINFNRRHGHVGHVFQGRFKAIHVNADEYLLELVRYIHLNPVRAKLCDGAADFAWSGHRAYLGELDCPWLRTDWVLAIFGRDILEARERYRAFVWAGRHEGRREEFHTRHESTLEPDADDFLRQVLAVSPKHVMGRELGAKTISNLVCDLAGLDAERLLTPSHAPEVTRVRCVATYIALTNKICTLSQLTPILGRDRTTLSRASMSVREQRADSGTFKLLDKVERYLGAAMHV